MLVFSDRSTWVDAGERLDALRERIALIATMHSGLARHSRLVGALIDAGQLLQGIVDSDLPQADALNRFTCQLARCVGRSWGSGFASLDPLPDVPRLDLDARVELHVPEGFAFYAVYPEAYAEAARRLRLGGPPRVIGIRSIGTTLAAVVAAALDAAPPVTVRPFGDPFARRANLPVELLDERSHYVIVDEGPGLSGSSFGAVADWLQERGVPLERIAFLPSHGGDIGPQGSETHRRRWHEAQRVPAEFDRSWLEQRFGPLKRLHAGERLKFLGWHDGERVLLKFAGLGAIGEHKLRMARALHAAGFTSEPLGLAHGFLVERWHEEARPLARGEKPVIKIGRYIGARARLFPADRDSGASIEQLLTMCRRNILLAMGEDWNGVTPSLRIARVRTDNKLDRAKWLRMADGRLLKTDALDHHQGHDLIGCQGVAWDVAGAISEFELTDGEAAALIAASAATIDPGLLAFYRIAYAAFRVGHATLAGTAAAERYKRQLQELLHQHACG